MTELERIFSDGLIIDVDFCKWDRFIDIWVLSDHFNDYPSRIPLLRVRFTGVKSFNIEFNHHHISLEKDRYFKWNTCELIINNEGDNINYKIIGDSPSPDIQFICSDVSYEQKDHILFDKTFSDWDKPYQPLARRGIEELYQMLFERK